MDREHESAQVAEQETKTEESAIARAIAFGIDITLVKRNLQMTPTARVRQADEARDSVIALQAEVRRWRERQRSNR